MFKKRHPRAGARPGTLVIPHDALPLQLRLTQYGPDFVSVQTIDDLAHINDHLDEATVTWIRVSGLGDEATLRALADRFAIHPLAMEDIVNVPQRPKAEMYGDQQLIICRAVSMADPRSIHFEQITLLVGPNYLITFQEDHADLFGAVEQRIRIPDSRLRQSGTDYLAYALMDAIIDAYYPVLEATGEQLEQLEDHVIENPRPELLKQLNSIRQQLARLRRAIWPKRELIRTLIHDENPLMGQQARMFLRDTHDHAMQVSEAVDMCRESVTSLMNSYLSAVGHRTNEVMKVLTIMSSIFVPLTFLAGIYGMNFEYMPELQQRWAYPMVWMAMFGCAAAMLVFFRRKGWIGGDTTPALLAQQMLGSPAQGQPRAPSSERLAEPSLPRSTSTQPLPPPQSEARTLQVRRAS